VQPLGSLPEFEISSMPEAQDQKAGGDFDQADQQGQ
jgi:hypothetical protein